MNYCDFLYQFIEYKPEKTELIENIFILQKNPLIKFQKNLDELIFVKIIRLRTNIKLKIKKIKQNNNNAVFITK
jgi:hypothetical protein